MSNYETTISLIRSIAGQSAIIAIPRVFIHITGDIKAALLLSQCIFWSDKGDREDGFVYKTMEEWNRETGLTKNELYTARDKVAGLVEFKVMKANGAPTLHFKVDMEAVANKISVFLETGNSEIRKIENRKRGKSLTDIKAVNNNQSRKKESPTPETPPKPPRAKKPTIPKEVIEPMEVALSEVTGMDRLLNIGQIGREAKALITAGITPEEVCRFYGPDGAWYRKDWRGQKGQRPNPADIRKTIAGYRKDARLVPLPVEDDYSDDDAPAVPPAPQPQREPDYWEKLRDIIITAQRPDRDLVRLLKTGRLAGIQGGTMTVAIAEPDLIAARFGATANKRAPALNGGSIARVAFVGAEAQNV